MLYFAYGSNMNFKQIKQRCPSSKFIKSVYLEKHKFVYDGYSKKWNAAVANIIDTSAREDIVWGGLFEINEDNLATLDCYENYPESYDRKAISVKDKEGKVYDEAITYFRIGKKVGTPHETYRQIVVKGARDCELSEDYISNTPI